MTTYTTLAAALANPPPPVQGLPPPHIVTIQTLTGTYYVWTY